MFDLGILSSVLTYGLALLFAIAGGLCVIVYFSSYIEEKINSFIKILKVVQWVVLIISVMLIFGDAYASVKISTIVSNLTWILFTKQEKFPRVQFTASISFFAFIFTVFSHFFWLNYFLSESDEVTSVASYFVVVVWLIPIFIFATVMAADDEDTEKPEVEASPKLEHKKEGKLHKLVSSFLKTDSLLPNRIEKDK